MPSQDAAPAYTASTSSLCIFKTFYLKRIKVCNANPLFKVFDFPRLFAALNATTTKNQFQFS